MPSWNIHIAQTEELLQRGGSLARSVRDRNAFLFGNIVPDIFVGYMVPSVTDPIPYIITHFAKSEPIPKPSEHEFWNAYVKPLIAASDCGEPARIVTIDEEREFLNRTHYPKRYEDAPPLEPLETEHDTAPTSDDVARSIFDLVLGAWTHLVADNVWNSNVNKYLASIGGKPSEDFRIKKQRDFDKFGRTHELHDVPRATERLFQAAEQFPQYAISRRYTLESIGVCHEIVRTNSGSSQHEPYQLLTDDFFKKVFSEVVEGTEAAYATRMANPNHTATPFFQSL